MTKANSHRRLGAALTAAIAVTGAVAASAPAASAAKLRTGIYDCTGSTGSYYYNSVRIRKGGRYEYATARNGKRLIHPTKGTYKVAGKKIRWTSGTYKKAGNESTIYKNYFSIERKSNHTWTGISCYYQPHPTGAQGAQ